MKFIIVDKKKLEVEIRKNNPQKKIAIPLNLRKAHQDLSPIEIYRQYANPWELYEPIRPRIFPASAIELTQIADGQIEMPRHISSKPPTGSFK